MFIDHRYEVLDFLGSGSWGEVYKVRDIRSDEIYSLKLYRFLSSAEIYEKFQAEEMHQITQIDHPNLANIYDFGHVGDHIYFLSDYYNGKTLKEFKYKKANQSKLYDVIAQICYALHALHSLNIIHKDLKLENILFREEKNKIEVKVIDYGFSKIEFKDEQTRITGTLPYVAPEVYLGKNPLYASDFYSLGVILYKLTTGSFPFTLEQMGALVAGSNQYFIPKFPSELNKEIPPVLERFILRLLDRNPESRFSTAEDIINHLNRIQTKQYPFSLEWTLVNKLKFYSYIARENYSHQILSYLDSIQLGNGKVVSLIGGDGLGKDNILSLFRYHILSKDYYLFDYTCSKRNHEPFFALTKEFMHSLSETELKKYDSLVSISEKFQKYLYESEKEAKAVTQSQEELRADFESVKNLMINLSNQKPIVFIIRNAQHVHRYTVDFVNFISPAVSKHRILIVLSFNDYDKVNQINHTVLIRISALDKEETREYMQKLLNSDVPDGFVHSLWKKSAGNPLFIREILFDLAQKKELFRERKFCFDIDFESYKLPSKLLHFIYSKMSHIKTKNYEFLQKLSIIMTPLTRELIIHILKIPDKVLYDFLNDAIYNEILEKSQQNYVFSFDESKERLISETEVEIHKSVSAKVIEYYKENRVFDVATCIGIIQNCQIAEDLSSEREFSLKLFELYEENYNQEKAFCAISDVLKIDLQNTETISIQQIKTDLSAFQEKIELSGYCEKALEIVPLLANIEDVFEKHYVLGTIFFINENITKATESFFRAENLITNDTQKTLLYLYLIQIFTRLDLDKAGEYLDCLSKLKLSLDLEIAYIDRLAVYYKFNGEIGKAIQVIEDYLDKLPSVQDAKVLIRLSSLHNNLGVFFSLQKKIDEANTHLNMALSIFKQFNLKRFLGAIYNNLADLYLKQGITDRALEYSKVGFSYAQETELKMMKALALLNMGEAHIKTGEFQAAEGFLIQANDMFLKLNNSTYLDSIKRNLALAKSKIKDFGYYYRFIYENEPELITGRIKEINPLVKTYFYYLFELGNEKKMSKLIKKNAHLNYFQIHEEEFYYNSLSLMALLSKDYELALSNLKDALQYAGEVKNHYAIVVFYFFQIRCLIGLRDYSQAEEVYNTAMKIAQKYSYRYWVLMLRYLKLMISLADVTMPLRIILRESFEIYAQCSQREYFILQYQAASLITQVLNEMKADEQKTDWNSTYNDLLRKAVSDINENDRKIFLEKHIFNSDFTQLKISSRYKEIKSYWNEIQNSVLNIKTADRIKFFIDKGIKDVIAPWKYQLMIYSEPSNTFSEFMSHNCKNQDLITSETYKMIDDALLSNTIQKSTVNDYHFLIIPLMIKNQKIGFICISDNKELEYTKFELNLLSSIKGQIASLIVRILDFNEITLRKNKMNHLMEITHNLMSIIDLKNLELEIVASCIDFTESTSGYLIKRDEEGNYLYQIAIDRKRSPLANVSYISKSAIFEAQLSREPIYTYNAMEDNRFKSSISVQDYKLHAILCAQLFVNDRIYGFIYLDNYLDNTQKLYLNSELIQLLLKQISIALKNAMQYDNLIQKSYELQSIESIKDEFMAIFSHELNTPLTTLQSYVSRLKRDLVSDEDHRKEIIRKIENSVRKLILTSNDIITMNKYNLIKKLPMIALNIEEILNILLNETEIIARERRMIFKTEIEPNLPQISANWEALHLMLYNILLNAIRFTNDFGTIVIGARKAAFQQEKIHNKETLVIYIHDNGIGIPEHQLKNVFRKFYELNEIYAHKSGSVEYRSSGLGLGLSTSKRIVELHEGKIWIKSKENEGTTVFISLPLKTTDNNK